jgi:hypothetical protein
VPALPALILKPDASPEDRQTHEQAASVMPNGRLVHIDGDKQYDPLPVGRTRNLMPDVTFTIDGAADLDHPAEQLWAAIADPVAYFTWNPVARLLDPVERLEPEMHLRIHSGTMGHTSYVHHNDRDAGIVRHEVGLSLRFLTLGHESHVWRFGERADGEPGCRVHQTMDVRLTTWLGRRLAGNLRGQMMTLHGENFGKLDAWLQAAPELSAGRFPLGAE